MLNIRKPSAPAALTGNFAEYRLIKTRGVLALIIEVPVERQAEAFAALGYPQPGTEIPVAVARLIDTPSVAEPRLASGAFNTEAPREVGDSVAQLNNARNAEVKSDNAHGRSARGKAHYASLTPEKQCVTRAALLAADRRFQEWQARGVHPSYVTERHAAEYIHHRCGIKSRRELATNPKARRLYDEMYTQYLQDTGQMAEVR